MYKSQQKTAPMGLVGQLSAETPSSERQWWTAPPSLISACLIYSIIEEAQNPINVPSRPDHLLHKLYAHVTHIYIHYNT